MLEECRYNLPDLDFLKVFLIPSNNLNQNFQFQKSKFNIRQNFHNKPKNQDPKKRIFFSKSVFFLFHFLYYLSNFFLRNNK